MHHYRYAVATIVRHQFKVVVHVMAWSSWLLGPTSYIRMCHSFLH